MSNPGPIPATPVPDTPYDPPQMPQPTPGTEIPGQTPTEAPGGSPAEIPVNDPGPPPQISPDPSPTGPTA